MKVVCRNCGDLPINLPDLPEGVYEVRQRYDYRFTIIMSCPECAKKGMLTLEDGFSSENIEDERWENKEDILEIQRVIGTEFQSVILNSDTKGGLEAVELGPNDATEEKLFDYACRGVIPIVAVDPPRTMPILNFEYFMNHFFKTVKFTYSRFPYERGYINHLMKANIFFLGEETDVYENTESICKAAELPFLLPFDNCLFFMRNEESGLWVVSHFYRIESFLSEWNPPDTPSSQVRHEVYSKTFEEYPDTIGYREWHSCNSHPESYRAQRDFGKESPMFVTREMWHAMLSGIEFDYEGSGMRAKAISRPIPLTSNADSVAMVRKTNGFVDTLFHVAAVSSPVNYVVKVTPKLTAKEQRWKKKNLKPNYGKRPHFIIVDHQAVTSLNPANHGTHISPRPHRRRGHWRRIGDFHRNLRARGIRMIPVRPSIVGKDRFEDGKNHYHVLMAHVPESVGN